MRNTLAVPSPMKSTAPQTIQESSTGDAGSSHATVHPDMKTAVMPNIAVLAVRTPCRLTMCMLRTR